MQLSVLQANCSPTNFKNNFFDKISIFFPDRYKSMLIYSLFLRQHGSNLHNILQIARSDEFFNLEIFI